MYYIKLDPETVILSNQHGSMTGRNNTKWVQIIHLSIFYTTSHQFIAGPRQTNTLIHTYRLLRVPDRPHLHVSGLWEEASVPRENSRTHRKNMQTLLRKVPGLVSNQQPSCCDATALTTEPPCRPKQHIQLEPNPGSRGPASIDFTLHQRLSECRSR